MWKIKIGEKEYESANDKLADFSHIPEYDRFDSIKDPMTGRPVSVHYFKEPVDFTMIIPEKFFYVLPDVKSFIFCQWVDRVHGASGSTRRNVFGKDLMNMQSIEVSENYR